MNQQDQFKGKVAFITGGARGIGKGIADILSERGASLAISDIDGDELEKVHEQYLSRGVEILIGTVDVTEKKSLDYFVSRVISKNTPDDCSRRGRECVRRSDRHSLGRPSRTRRCPR